MGALGTGRISPEQYAIAESNGICRKTLHTRVYVNDWDVERAITQPVIRREGLWEKWGPVSKVSKTAFHTRISRGMTPEEAALTPKTTKKNTGRIKEEHLKMAAENGVSKGTLHSRVYIYNWPLEKAITTPPKANGRRGKWDEGNSTRSKRKLQRG